MARGLAAQVSLPVEPSGQGRDVRCALASRYARTAWAIEPDPPDVTRPTGASCAPPPSRSRVIAMISASNFVALGHMSRWRVLTWLKRANTWLRKS